MLAGFDPIVDRGSSAAVRAICRYVRRRACAGDLIWPQRDKNLVADPEDSGIFDLRIQTSNNHQITMKVLPGQIFVAHQYAPQSISGRDLALLTFNFPSLVRPALCRAP